jgi:DNA-binding beta-propeller fold protein YncE
MVAPLLLWVLGWGRPPSCALAGPNERATWSGSLPLAATAPAPLQAIADVALPGGASRFDYQSLDPSTGRLFISHMGAGELVVFDVRNGQLLTTLKGFPGVTGVLSVAAEHRVYASATGDHAVVVVDDSALRVRTRIAGPRFPDGVAYAPDERRLFVSDETGARDFVIDAPGDSLVAHIDLGGEAGNTQYDAGAHCVIVAVQTVNAVAVIDPGTATIVRRVTLDPAVRYPHGITVDAGARLAFIAGEESGTLGVLDLQTFQLVQVLPVGADPDVLAFDPVLARLYVASESGVLAVFDERNRSLIQRGWYQAPEAHSVAVDPSTHLVYLPLANVKGNPVLRVLQPSDTP